VSEQRAEIRRLWANRPRSAFVRGSAIALVALAAYAWLFGDLSPADLFSERRLANLRRFLERDAMPVPLREAGFTWGGLLEWAGEIVAERGLDAMLATLWVGVAAIVLAAIAASVLAPLGSRTLMTHRPYEVRPPGPGETPWRFLVAATRLACVLLRAVPEYVWAFLLLAMLGPTAWPAVLALAIHNSGILGRLGAETVENLDVAPLRALRTAGATRRQLGLLVAYPLALPRFLLYFFYRFETCLREATVLGMLGIVSLGYWVQESRGRQLYDEMLLFVALGAVLVIVGDLVSLAARSWVRRA
jgi:phosphonate transport system permease protein